MIVPTDIPISHRPIFEENYRAITRGTDKLMLFACDQKIEQLNPINPEDFFVIAASAYVGAFATQPGLIARYGAQYQNIDYIAKLNAKTNLISSSQRDPSSRQGWSVEQVVQFAQESKLPIRGVAYALYPGSEFEDIQLAEAARIVHEAHQYGLIAMLWVYPRGKAVRHETEARVIIGAASIATALGADFVKVKVPTPERHASSAQLMNEVVKAAGNTTVLFAGGERQDPGKFLREVHDLLTIGKVGGCAVGRNIYEHDFAYAIKMAEALSSLVYKGQTLAHAQSIIGL
ncbi:MAG: hypothetical protein JW725_04845 [Candidatus Babeliaceae bacterium]|nr:hypothetical protein [Candidatus Babeliaceae bacterium]